jgi:hypothetical protein
MSDEDYDFHQQEVFNLDKDDVFFTDENRTDDVVRNKEESA